ncbi:MAG: hypothetical protein ACK6DP_02150 [Gemmatimonas sp.]|uniref:hypothetical protein n=1 Tax=Gemmatimonas sp. TaxID=1962908 RepID=UPI00391FBEAB|nr:hypothetical protein [Gemmatimonadota bacterium]
MSTVARFVEGPHNRRTPARRRIHLTQGRHRMSASSKVVREGVAAGLIGAFVIAVWFAIVDGLRGKILATPIMLGTSLASLFLGDVVPSDAGALLSYTLFHFAAFIAVGLVFAWIVDKAEAVPSALIGFAGLFAVFEVGWIGWTAVLSEGRYGTLSWVEVFVANLIAAGVMGWYMWRQHPALPRRVGAVLSGASEA